jgi:hypothetical protein
MRSTFRRAVGSAAAALALVLSASACDSATGLRTGTLSMYLTDAPGDVVAAVVTIEEIYLTSGDEENPRITLRDIPFTTDLLTLVDSTHLLLEDVEIPAGSYGQLRFVISGAYIEVEGDGGANAIYASSPTYAGLPESATVTGTLQMPSLAQSGLKVNLPGDALVVAADGAVSLIVDFDVSQSFGQLAGGSGMWVMTPVLQGIVPAPAP